MIIKNIEELKKMIAEYKERFPETALSLEHLTNLLVARAKERVAVDNNTDDPNIDIGERFGYSVSEEWPDRCYQFALVAKEPEFVFEFEGMAKC